MQSFEQSRDGVAIRVGPAADRVNGALNGAVVLTDRAMLPVFVAHRMMQPQFGEKNGVLQSVTPHGLPAFTDDLRIRR
jgi:hypothetical protein